MSSFEGIYPLGKTSCVHELYIPLAVNESATPKPRSRLCYILAWTGTLLLAFLLTASSVIHLHGGGSREDLAFYSHISRPEGICTGVDGRAFSSYAGYIGLKGDSDASPKRSFFWLFEAENDARNAPIILTIGGGPGTSGLMNPVMSQSHCLVSANGTFPNPHRWTEKFNLLALDHVLGFLMVLTSITAVQPRSTSDFLQKFFRLYPHLAKNKFVISGGSYGGVYVPNIATVIHEQNLALAKGQGQRGAVHVNLESLMLSNPLSDPISHFRWALHYRCVEKNVYNETTCLQLYARLPTCLETIEYSYEHPTSANRKAATMDCFEMLSADTNGTVIEDVRRKCSNTEDISVCFPEFAWARDYFAIPEIKKALGVPEHVNYAPLSVEVNGEFVEYGDPIQRHHLLYPPLLADGIRLLHYVGAQDANCAWPGVLSFLKLLQTPFQDAFLRAPDVPWPAKEEATVRVVGEGAGNMTFILVAEAGHLVAHDQPALAKSIVEHWIENRPFETDDLA